MRRVEKGGRDTEESADVSAGVPVADRPASSRGFSAISGERPRAGLVAPLRGQV